MNGSTTALPTCARVVTPRPARPAATRYCYAPRALPRNIVAAAPLMHQIQIPEEQNADRSATGSADQAGTTVGAAAGKSAGKSTARDTAADAASRRTVEARGAAAPHARRTAGARTARSTHALSDRYRDRRFARFGARSQSGHSRDAAGDNVKLRFETIV